jgi:hypothetical protein
MNFRKALLGNWAFTFCELWHGLVILVKSKPPKSSWTLEIQRQMLIVEVKKLIIIVIGSPKYIYIP